MTRQTDNHEWLWPEPGDTNWDAAIEQTLDAIDSNVPIDPDTEPSAGDNTGSLLVNRFTDRPVPVLQYDSGTALTQVQTAQRWDVHRAAWTNRQQTVISEWTFEEPIVGDIDGKAGFASEATTADSASEADLLDGFAPGDFAITTEPFVVSGDWTFEQAPAFRGGLDIVGGTLGLGQFSNPILDEYPPEPDHDPLSIITADAVNIGPRWVTLEVEVESLGNYDELFVGFDIAHEDHYRVFNEYQINGPAKAISSPGVRSQDYPTKGQYPTDFFDPGEIYVYRAFATDSHGDRVAHGSVRTVPLPDIEPENNDERGRIVEADESEGGIVLADEADATVQTQTTTTNTDSGTDDSDSDTDTDSGGGGWDGPDAEPIAVEQTR